MEIRRNKRKLINNTYRGITDLAIRFGLRVSGRKFINCTLTNENLWRWQSEKDRSILIAFDLNFAFSVFELFGGIFTHSVAILSDSVHDFGDAAPIGLSYLLEKKSKRDTDAGHNYGYRRYSVLGGLITTVILIIGSV